MSQNSEVLHSRIGASSMHRWSICPGSVKLSEGIPSRSSKYAEEGTTAHDLAAKILMTEDILRIESTIGSYPSEMIEAVMVYCNAVDDEMDAGCKLLVEHKFDLSEIHPGLFGTSDAVIFNPNKALLQVFDYKHGAGIAVEVDNNEQLMYYGLGALLSTGFKAKEVELVIVQPRCEHPGGAIRRWKFEALDLLDFAADLKKFAEATEQDNAPLKAGDHCRFCPAAIKCPLMHEKSLALAKEEFKPTWSYDPEKLSKTLDMLPAVEAWAKNVREFAYAEAEHGRTPPGYKLVEKRATRKWASEAEVLKLAEEGELPKEFLETSLISVAQAEKVIGKKAFEKTYGHMIKKESSGATLVHESDPRPAVLTGAAADFTKIETDIFS